MMLKIPSFSAFLHSVMSPHQCLTHPCCLWCSSAQPVSSEHKRLKLEPSLAHLSSCHINFGTVTAVPLPGQSSWAGGSAQAPWMGSAAPQFWLKMEQHHFSSLLVLPVALPATPGGLRVLLCQSGNLVGDTEPVMGSHWGEVACKTQIS